VCGDLEFDSDQESGSGIASHAETGTSKTCHFLEQPNITEVKPIWRQYAAAAPTLSVQRVRRCTAAPDYTAYFVEHTSLKASTICSLYECL
jgi:hypothetical protein